MEGKGAVIGKASVKGTDGEKRQRGGRVKALFC